MKTWPIVCTDRPTLRDVYIGERNITARVLRGGTIISISGVPYDNIPDDVKYAGGVIVGGDISIGQFDVTIVDPFTPSYASQEALDELEQMLADEIKKSIKSQLELELDNVREHG